MKHMERKKGNHKKQNKKQKKEKKKKTQLYIHLEIKQSKAPQLTERNVQSNRPTPSQSVLKDVCP